MMKALRKVKASTSSRQLASTIAEDPVHKRFYSELVNLRERGGNSTWSFGPPSVRLNTRELLAGYSKYPWLRAVVEKTAHIAASVQWKALKGDEELRNHPILRPLHEGNSYMPGISVRKMIVLYLCLVGEAFLWKERNRMGVVIALWPIPPHWIEDVPLRADGSFKLRISGMSESVEIPRSEVIHFCYPDPVMPYGRGSGSATSLADELETDEFASKHLKMFFKNNARPDLLIYSEDEENPITPEDAVRLETSWLEKLRGVFRAHRPFFLPGKVGVKEIQSSLRDMQMLDLRRFQRDIVLNVYGFPPEALGILEDSNRATIESAEYFLSKHVVLPFLNFIREVLLKELASEFDAQLGLGFKSPVEEDKAHILRVMRTAPWAFTIDEWRRQAEHEPLKDGADGAKFPHPSGTVFVEEHTSDNPNNPASQDDGEGDDGEEEEQSAAAG